MSIVSHSTSSRNSVKESIGITLRVLSFTHHSSLQQVNVLARSLPLLEGLSWAVHWSYPKPLSSLFQRVRGYEAIEAFWGDISVTNVTCTLTEHRTYPALRMTSRFACTTRVWPEWWNSTPVAIDFPCLSFSRIRRLHRAETNTLRFGRSMFGR